MEVSHSDTPKLFAQIGKEDSANEFYVNADELLRRLFPLSR